MAVDAVHRGGDRAGNRRLIRRIGKSGARRTALVCFPFAGGSPAAFRPWADRLADRFELWTAVGRDREYTGAPAEQWPTLIRRYADDLAEIEEPLVLYGHSMGAVLAFETARELRRRGRAVRRLVVSGRRAPNLPAPGRASLPADPVALLHAVARRFGGIPAQVLAEPETAHHFGTEMAADFALVSSYVWRDEQSLDVPLAALAGADDPAVDDDGLNAWGILTSAEFTVVRIPGGHFFTPAQLGALFEQLDPESR